MTDYDEVAAGAMRAVRISNQEMQYTIHHI